MHAEATYEPAPHVPHAEHALGYSGLLSAVGLPACRLKVCPAIHCTQDVRAAFGAYPTTQSHGHPFHDSLNKTGVSQYAKPAFTIFAPAPVHCEHTVAPADL